MISSLIDILLRGFEGDGAPLKDNGFARRLTSGIINQRALPDNRTRFLSDLFKSVVPLKLPTYSGATGGDLRIKCLFLSNVRQYKINDSQASYYSLDFSEGSEPTSSVFHGPNGSGKTTVYASLEYLYLRHSDIAASHMKASDSSELEYFRSIKCGPDEINMKAHIAGGDIDFNDALDSDIPAAFCSECDYFEIMHNWNKKEDYFAEQLGYRELVQLMGLLQEVNQLYTTTQKYIKDSGESEIIKKELKGLSPATKEYNQLTLQKDKLFKEKTATNSLFLETGVKYGYRHISQFVRRIENNFIAETNFEELLKLSQYLETEWKKILNRLLEVAAPIIQAVVGESLDKQSESIELKAEGNRLQMQLKLDSLRAGEDPEDKSPVEYFNTFRLKLFCVAVKMGLYCCAKTIHGINLPFVMDDVFDSSDFSNRTKIRVFIKKLHQSHDDVMKTPLEGIKPENLHPIQMIFFTQDNLIADNVYQGLKDLNEVDGREDINVKYGRLYCPKDANPPCEAGIDYRNYVIDGKEEVTTKIYDLYTD